MPVPTFYVCPHLLCLSPPIMSIPTFYVCAHLLYLSQPIMSVLTYYVCPHLLCLSPPIMPVPTYILTPTCMTVPTYCHTQLHLGFLAKLRICQASACKMEPRSGIISCKNPTYQPTRHLILEVIDLSIYLIDLQLD